MRRGAGGFGADGQKMSSVAAGRGKHQQQFACVDIVKNFILVFP